jgi:hypothetical protein
MVWWMESYLNQTTGCTQGGKMTGQPPKTDQALMVCMGMSSSLSNKTGCCQSRDHLELKAVAVQDIPSGIKALL